jgi:aconitate hydratase
MSAVRLPGATGIQHHSVADAAAAGLPGPLLVLLESLLAHAGSPDAAEASVAEIRGWTGDGTARAEVPFWPQRILLQDFTGVPVLADLAAIREAVLRLGGRAEDVLPEVPVDLVVDHSISVDRSRSQDAMEQNVALDYGRNRERYEFLRWGSASLPGFSVLPPNTGICHQVNLERLATVTSVRDGVAVADTVLGTDSHTPMVNGLGVLGWGVGGIEAESAMLGEPAMLVLPDVVGLRLVGELPPGVTATDLVLTVTEALRRHGVVGAFVDAYGPAISALPVPVRATIANMTPEYGATCTLFPIDQRTLDYLRLTGRAEEHISIVEAHAKAQGLWHDPSRERRHSSTVDIELGAIVPCVAGPSRPQDRVPLTDLTSTYRRAVAAARRAGSSRALAAGTVDEGSEESFPASDPPAAMSSGGATSVIDPPEESVSTTTAPPSDSRSDDALVADGDVVIAAITSCTNTSNPDVMIAAGLLAKRAVERGMHVRDTVKTSLAPGSRSVVAYLQRAGLMQPLEELGFALVGFGCTTCIGNSGPLDHAVSEAIARDSLVTSAVLSGNRNFESRIHPEVQMNWLASPPLVVAFALAGTVDVDLTREPVGVDRDGGPVWLRDIWPTEAEIDETVRVVVEAADFGRSGAGDADHRWQALGSAGGTLFPWRAESTYVRRPPFLDDVSIASSAPADVVGARVLLALGDSVTTDHISPAGSIDPDSPAGRWLLEHGVAADDFNSYGARRGNHEVMVRGTFANRRLRNVLVERSGGFTRHAPSGDIMDVYTAAQRYAQEGVPLVVIGGREYGTGSSRDWAAKGTSLLGIRAVIAESFERIHRSNLVGMGVAPVQIYAPIELDPEAVANAVVDVQGIAGISRREPPYDVTVRIDGRAFPARLRIDSRSEAATYAAGGILPLAARRLAGLPLASS